MNGARRALQRGVRQYYQGNIPSNPANGPIRGYSSYERETSWTWSLKMTIRKVQRIVGLHETPQTLGTTVDDEPSSSVPNRQKQGAKAEEAEGLSEESRQHSFGTERIYRDAGNVANPTMGEPSSQEVPPPPYSDTDTYKHHVPSIAPAPRPIPTQIPPQSFPLRQIRRHESSNSIKGQYPLYDLLDLETASGSISVTIDPQPGDGPAILMLSSRSGSINVRFSAGNINRAYQTTISSISGSVSGMLYVSGGGTAAISTRSGSINLDVYPNDVGIGAAESSFRTSSLSGSQHINFYDPTTGGGVQTMAASITSPGSGALHLRMPFSWEGQVHAKSDGSGSVNVYGRDLRVEQHGSKDIYGWRGTGQTLTSVEVYSAGSGSVNFSC